MKTPLHKEGRGMEYFLALCGIWAAAALIYLALDNAAAIVFPAAACTAVIALSFFFPERMKAAAGYLFRYRWLAALGVFALCVLLRLNGSSMGVYDQIFVTKISPRESILFGEARWIRSDEFGVQTPKFLSQAYNGFGLYSDRVGLSPANMVLDYYSPVRDWTAIGKPLMWGYLLFGGETGLSWYWCAQGILIFMTALEMLRVLTEDCRWASVLGAAAVLLSPFVQWWFMPHMPVVLLYAMGLFCVGYWFFTARSTAARWCFSALAVVTATGFALSIFPAFQIPCAYAVAFLLAACLYRDRERITFKARQWYLIALPAALTALILVNFALSSWDEIMVLLHTVYPGRRECCGGDASFRDLFTDLTSLYLPYWDITYANNCEVASWLHLAPLIFVMFPQMYAYLRRRGSGARTVGLVMTLVLAACGIYMCVGIPLSIAKLTLLRFCNRMKGVYGWLAVLYTFWGIAVVEKYPDMLKLWQKIVYPLAYAGMYLLVLDENAKTYFRSFALCGLSRAWVLLPAAGILGAGMLVAAVLFNRRRLVCAVLAATLAVAGLPVNPLVRGTGSVTDHPISRSVSEIARREPDSRWLALDCVFLLPNFLAANGARVLNATNFYPDRDKWAVLDPSGAFEEYTNRYAHQSMSLTDSGSVSVEPVSPDHISTLLPPEKLKELDVRYLLSTVDYTELLKRSGIGCTLVDTQDGYAIYRLQYEE